MPRKILLTGLYTDVLKAADAIDGLRLLGLREDDMQVAQGVPPFSPGLAACLLTEFARRSAAHTEATPAASTGDDRPSVTSRQLEVLRAVAAGHTYRETGALLAMSERTVRYHMAELLDRLHLQHRSQVITFAAEAGLLDTQG